MIDKFFCIYGNINDQLREKRIVHTLHKFVVRYLLILILTMSMILGKYNKGYALKL